MLKQPNILETRHSKTASPLSLSRVGPRHVEASGFILPGAGDDINRPRATENKQCCGLLSPVTCLILFCTFPRTSLATATSAGSGAPLSPTNFPLLSSLEFDWAFHRWLGLILFQWHPMAPLIPLIQLHGTNWLVKLDLNCMVKWPKSVAPAGRSNGWPTCRCCQTPWSMPHRQHQFPKLSCEFMGTLQIYKEKTPQVTSEWG